MIDPFGRVPVTSYSVVYALHIAVGDMWSMR